jgi:hypothetical protein
MYENKFNTGLKEQIIGLAAINAREEIILLIKKEVKECNIYPGDLIFFCSCGYPVSYGSPDNKKWLAELINQEVDFRSYREYYYCPKCNRLLEEFQR